jgi:hypothetical protein
MSNLTRRAVLVGCVGAAAALLAGRSHAKPKRKSRYADVYGDTY